MDRQGSGQPHADGRQRDSIVVVLIAYEADARLRELLERVPDEVRCSPRWRFLVVEDGTEGAAAKLVREWGAQRGVERVTALHVPKGLGYGGIQKVAFRWAVDAGHAMVVVLPGDGQFPPEALPVLADVSERTGADVVLTTRVGAGAETSNAMPRVWRWGNRVVSSVQNRLTGGAVSEFHSGYRAYSTAFLASAPFELASNGYVFDTEIVLQAFFVAARIEEVPIRVAYDRRIRREGRVAYAWSSLRSALQFRLHQWGMFCSLKYRHLARVRYVDKGHVLYSSHAEALRIVRACAPRRLLDLGCGPGFVARRCEEMGIRVTGVDVVPPIPGNVTDFVAADLDRDALPVDAFSFDLVLFLDVIEHLSDPEGFLLGLRNASRSIVGREPPPVLVLSTPNVAFVAVRLNLLLGIFNYAERGILDVGHKRLFTKRSLLLTLRQCGYVVERVVPVGVPFEAVFRGAFGTVAGGVARFLARLWPSLFAFQFLVVCRPLPGVAQLVASGADRASPPREQDERSDATALRTVLEP